MEAVIADVPGAKKHRVTIPYKSKSKTPRLRTIRPNPISTKKEETVLVKWILAVAKAGFPTANLQPLKSVQKIIIGSKRTESPFKNNRAGNIWFLKSRPVIKIRTSESLTDELKMLILMKAKRF